MQNYYFPYRSVPLLFYENLLPCGVFCCFILPLFLKERQCVLQKLLFPERDHVRMSEASNRQFLQSLFAIQSFQGYSGHEFFVVPLSYS